MKNIRKINNIVIARGEDGEELKIGYSNRGEPYKQGAEIELFLKDEFSELSVFIEDYELRRLRDSINKFLDE